MSLRKVQERKSSASSRGRCRRRQMKEMTSRTIGSSDSKRSRGVMVSLPMLTLGYEHCRGTIPTILTSRRGAMAGKSVAGVFLYLTGIAVLFGIGVTPASAVIIRGIDFPAGNLSFMDELVSYSPKGVGIPTAPHRDPFTSLGPPDFNGDNNCTDNLSCTFVSLGSGG